MGPLDLSRHDVQLIDRPAFLSFFRYTPSACPIRTPILVLWGSRSPQIPRKRSPSPPPREFFGFRHPGLSRDGTTSGGPSPSSPSGGPSPQKPLCGVCAPFTPGVLIRHGVSSRDRACSWWVLHSLLWFFNWSKKNYLTEYRKFSNRRRASI